MKKLIVALSLIGLAGCAAPPPGPPNYGSRVQTDPAGWQTVSVTQVPLGTGARMAAQSDGNQAATVDPAPAPAAAPANPPATTSSTTTTTSTSPVYVQQPIYVQQPVYVPAPVYAPAPVYYPPSPYYWWPPISIGLGFSWSHWDGGHGHGWGGHGWSGGHGGWHGHH